MILETTETKQSDSSLHNTTSLVLAENLVAYKRSHPPSLPNRGEKWITAIPATLVEA